jgi:hypothetical protein
MKRFGLVLAMAVTPYLWSCSGDDNQAPKEPVAAEQDTNKVPDNPGTSGEAAATKPAGAGQANADQAAMPATPEKSTPDTAAAANTTPTPQEKAAAEGEMMVKAGALNVRKGPGTKNPVVRTLKRGEKVSPMSCDKGWCKLADNEYVSKKYLTKGK